MPEKTDQYDQKCSMFKRLASIFYDSLCLFSLFFLTTLILIYFTKGESIASNNIAYDLFLALITYLYFVWQWTHGGQTLGMRSWKIRLYQDDERPVSWLRASSRFALASLSFITLGMGFIWALFDANRLTFHDRYSRTLLLLR